MVMERYGIPLQMLECIKPYLKGFDAYQRVSRWHEAFQKSLDDTIDCAMIDVFSPKVRYVSFSEKFYPRYGYRQHLSQSREVFVVHSDPSFKQDQYHDLILLDFGVYRIFESDGERIKGSCPFSWFVYNLSLYWFLGVIHSSVPYGIWSRIPLGGDWRIDGNDFVFGSIRKCHNGADRFGRFASYVDDENFDTLVFYHLVDCIAYHYADSGITEPYLETYTNVGQFDSYLELLNLDYYRIPTSEERSMLDVLWSHQEPSSIG